MKKLLSLVLVISIASIASASFLISVNGVVNPTQEITIAPSGELIIDIHGVENGSGSQGFWLLCQGPGTIDGGTTEYYGATGVKGSLNEILTQNTAGWIAYYELEEDPFPSYGYMGVTGGSRVTIGHSGTPPYLPLNGLLVDNILFHCEGEGPVVLTLLSDDFGTVYDTQIIQQIPEPATMAILALGGLLIRKK